MELISRKADLNLIDAAKSRAEAVEDGDVLETPEYVIFTIGMDSDDGHLNGVMCLDDDYAVEAMRAADDYFKPLGRSYSFWVRGDENKKLEKLLKQSGHTAKREPGSAVMVIDRKIEGLELKGGYSLKKVESEEDRKSLVKVVSECFEKEISLAEHMFSLQETVEAENVVSYVIYEDDNPVASAITVSSGDVAGIYWVGVIPEKRREGLGGYIVQVSTNAGFDMGAKEVILQASEVGEYLYDKLGYRTIKRYRGYPIKALDEKISF